MQANVRANASGFNRLKVALIVAGLMTSILVVVTIFLLSQNSNATSAVPVANRAVVHRPADRPFPHSYSAPVTTMQRFYAAKEARQEGLELAAATLTTNASKTDALQRFYARKEALMDVEFFVITAQPTPAQRVAADKESRMDAQEQLRSELAAQAKGRQMTSDMAYVVEADQLALQHAAQAARLYVTPDEAYASEQALMIEQARHLARMADHDAWRVAEMNQLPGDEEHLLPQEVTQPLELRLVIPTFRPTDPAAN